MLRHAEPDMTVAHPAREPAGEPAEEPGEGGVVVTCRVDPESKTAFADALNDVLRQARASAGYRNGVALWRPAGQLQECSAVFQFRDEAARVSWQRSPAFQDWLRRCAELNADPAAPDVVVGAGTELSVSADAPVAAASKAGPPRHKMAVVMFVSVYPTITFLLWLLWPVVAGMPLPARTLVLSVVMVPLMTWFIVPWVTARFAGWLGGARS